MPVSSMKNKTVLITGATDGVGKQSAKELAKMGAITVLVGRNEERCKQAVDDIVQHSGKSQIHYLVADLSIMGDVKRLAEDFRSRFSRLDVLINNAGGSFLKRHLTVDGFERTFALNHLAYFLLTDLLMDLLKSSAPSRVINTSSGSHRHGKIHYRNPHLKRNYFVYRAYSQSKLANVMFTYALARRLEGSGITANCLHPGLVQTGIFRKVVGPVLEKILIRNAISVEEGAETIVYLASAKEVAEESGNYYFKNKPRTSVNFSYDTNAQERLWDLSCDMLKPWLVQTNQHEI